MVEVGTGLIIAFSISGLVGIAGSAACIVSMIKNTIALWPIYLMLLSTVSMGVIAVIAWHLDKITV